MSLIKVPILLALMFIVKRYKAPEKGLKENTEISDTKLFDRKESRRILIIIVISICLATYNAFETTFFNFSPTYYQNFALKLTASKSAEIASVAATSYTVGRGVSVFIAFKIKPQLMISYHLIISIIAVIILAFAEYSITVLWVGNILIGFGFSALSPAIFAYIREYISLTDRIGAIFTFSCASLNSISPLILGSFIEENPIIFIICLFVFSSTTILLFIIILYIVKKSIIN
jgi:sugar phosphate permease